jgi:hypothetical protein
VLAVSVPPQVLAALPEIIKPLGSVSSNAVIVAAVAFALINFIVTVETPSTAILAGLNDLLSVGGTVAGRTTTVATAGPALLPWLVCNAPAGRVLT